MNLDEDMPVCGLLKSNAVMLETRMKVLPVAEQVAQSQMQIESKVVFI